MFSKRFGSYEKITAQRTQKSIYFYFVHAKDVVTVWESVAVSARRNSCMGAGVEGAVSDSGGEAGGGRGAGEADNGGRLRMGEAGSR